MEKELNVVGTRVPMLDAAQKAKRAALFTDDLVLPGMHNGRVLRSPVPHARIRHIDTSRAETSHVHYRQDGCQKGRYDSCPEISSLCRWRRLQQHSPDYDRLVLFFPHDPLSRAESDL